LETCILSSAHWQIRCERDERVAWLIRSAVPFGSLAQLQVANGEIARTLGAQFLTWGVVVDLRLAPPRNDPAFEKTSQRLRATVEQSFERTAVLTTTEVGRLQVQRLARQEGARFFATTEPEAALAFARGKARKTQALSAAPPNAHLHIRTAP
jgi:hypothetical protein